MRLNAHAANKSIPAIWADSHILSSISLIFVGFRADRLLIRLRIFATLPVRRLVWFYQ